MLRWVGIILMFLGVIHADEKQVLPLVLLPGSIEYTDRLPSSWKPFTKIKAGARGTDAFQLLPGLSIKLGKNSLVMVETPDADHFRLLLTQGRMRVMDQHGMSLVRTPACTIDLKSGTSDIIITNLNTLCITREGEGMGVKTPLDRVDVSAENYVLATPQGALVVTPIEKEDANF